MASFKIEWRQSALRDLKRLDRHAIPRIVQAVDALAAHPFPPGIRKLRGAEGEYRLRVGDYRVIYSVFQTLLIVQIVRVRHRKEVYRG